MIARQNYRPKPSKTKFGKMIAHLDEMLSNETVVGIGKIKFGKMIDHFANFSFAKNKVR